MWPLNNISLEKTYEKYAIPLLSGSNNNNNNNSNSAILGPTTMNGKTPTDSVTFTASIVK